MRDRSKLLGALIPVISFLSLARAAPAQEVDLELEKRIDAAVARGAKWLKAKYDVKNPPALSGLAALALVAAGTPPKDPLINSIMLLTYFDRIPSDPHTLVLVSAGTYYIGFRTCLWALRHKSDPTDLVSFLNLVASTKFLVDTQFRVGRWSYPGRHYPWGKNGVPPYEVYRSKIMSPFLSKIRRELEELRKDPARHKGPDPYPIRIPRQPVFEEFWGKNHGDHSNSQFAMLALYAATRARLKVTEKISARIVLPEETLFRYLRALLQDQQRDGGWSYTIKGEFSYGSMTYAGVFGLLAVRKIASELPKEAQDKAMRNSLNRELKKVESSLRAALRWVKKHFDVRKNPRVTKNGVYEDDARFLYYTFFSLERAATMASASGYEFGKSDWFKQGAEFLLGAQKKDGGWPEEKTVGGTPGDPKVSNRILSTVFAILFLKRFTSRIAPPVETPRKNSGGKKK